jgi:gluconate 5-dehydrogenase
MGGYPDFSLSGRTALVTGSVRGLGLEMARGLARAGARVVLNGRDAGTLDAAAARLRDEGLNVTAAAFDVTDQDTARESVTALGPVDVLVNNVGHRDRRGVDALAPGDLARLLEVHLISAYALSQVVARDLISRGRPDRIIGPRSAAGGGPRRSPGVVVFLAGDTASFITGQTIAVDGGMTTTF